MKAIQLLLAAAMLAAPAHAQRDAVSPALSPEAAGQIFRKAVVEACVPAVTSGGISALATTERGSLQPTQDAQMRQQAGAGPDETVWDVADARGVVTVREKAGRCVVSVYGPMVAPTIMELAAELERTHGFERLVMPQAPNGPRQSLSRDIAGRRVMVQLEGAQPGTAGHQSRFSVVTATVFVAQ
jgi:hypothetical protein